VARARVPRARLPGPRGSGAEAMGAGMTIIVIVVLLAAGGVYAARAVDPRAEFAGGLVGGLLGLVAAFAGVYTRYRDG